MPVRMLQRSHGVLYNANLFNQLYNIILRYTLAPKLSTYFFLNEKNKRASKKIEN